MNSISFMEIVPQGLPISCGLREVLPMLKQRSFAALQQKSLWSSHASFTYLLSKDVWMCLGKRQIKKQKQWYSSQVLDLRFLECG
jgi:hypothetical protein